MKIPREIFGVAKRLQDLRDKVVFVGGMIRSVLVTDPGADLGRPTKDVDLILDVHSRAAYFSLAEILRSRGFRESIDEGAPLCRWNVDGITADIMPIDPAILGFSNVWYADALKHSLQFEGEGGAVRILDAPRFCATKLEAFASRGNRDFYHRDLEDVVAVVDGRPTLIDEIRSAPSDLRDFLSTVISELLTETAFIESLQGHLPPDDGSQGRLPTLIATLRAIAALATEQTIAGSPPSIFGGQLGAPISFSSIPATLNSHDFVRSSNLRSGAYDVDKRELVLEFRSGSKYLYSNVPTNIFLGLTQAFSAGRYFHQWIRSRYPTRRVA
jgi:hypothetical protein